MLKIERPVEGRTIPVAEYPRQIILGEGDNALTLSTLPRPGNYAETVYLRRDGALDFVPDTPPTIAAHLSITGPDAVLTLYPLASSIAQAPTFEG